MAICPFYGLWKFKASPMVIAFGWLVLHNGVLTMESLRKRKKVIVHALCAWQTTK